jgi:Cu/Ag efflux pump CusA
MTSIAFGLGVLPLALSTGAGAGSQNAIGTGVVGGTVTTTILGLFFVPLYFVTVLKFFRVKRAHPPGQPQPAILGGSGGLLAEPKTTP